jgi:hypothetical protein
MPETEVEELILNNGAIIEHDHRVGVVDPLTKHTYEQLKRPLSDHTLKVGEDISLDIFLSKPENIDVPEGSCLSFIHVLYYYFHISSTFYSCYNYIQCDICMICIFYVIYDRKSELCTTNEHSNKETEKERRPN